MAPPPQGNSRSTNAEYLKKEKQLSGGLGKGINDLVNKYIKNFRINK